MVDLGDLKVRLGLNTTELDAGVQRAQQKLRALGQNVPDPKLGIDTGGFDANVGRSAQGLNQIGASATRSAGQVGVASANMKTAMGGVADGLLPISMGYAGIGLAAGLAAKSVFNSASDMEESQSKVNVVFGKSAEGINRFAADAATSLGLSESAALDATGTFGNLFVSMEMGEAAAAEMSIGIVQLAADLGSFNNIGTDVALEKLRAGLVGEIEPLRSLGVNINAVMVQNKALAMGLANTADALTTADKAQASYALILEQTKTAQGDFARTSEGAANSLKTTEGAVGDLQVAVGEGLTPAVATLAQKTTEVVVPLTEMVTTLNDLGGAIPGVTGETGLLSHAIDQAMLPTTVLTEGFGILSGIADRFSDDEGPKLTAVIHNVAESMRIASGDGTIFQTTLAEIKQEAAETEAALQKLYESGASDYATDLERLARNGRAATVSQNEYTESLGRSAEMAGLANERNSDYFLGIQLGSGDAATLAYTLDQVAESQESLAGAYQDGLQIQSNYTSQAGEYAQQQSIIEEGNKVLEERLAKGLITQEEYNQAIADGEFALARYEGGQEDATLTARDYAIQNAELMRIQDEIQAQFPDLVQGSAEYNAKLEEAATKAGISQGAIDDMKGSNANFAGVIANELVPALRDLINTIAELDGKTAAVTVRTNYVSNGSPGAGGVGFTAMAQGDIVDEPTFALIGEDGPELVLPLTKPDRMKALLAQAGIPAWADGGGVMPGGGAAGGAAGLTLDVSVTGVPINWDFLFEGLDEASETYAADAADRIAAFIERLDGAALASGEALADAEAKLASLVNARTIAEEMGLGEAVVAELQAKIDAQQAEVAAIGGAMATPFVEGLAASLRSGELAEELAAFRQGVFEGFDLGDGTAALEAALGRLTALRNAAAEMGDTATADALTAQIATLNGELALTTDILATDAVQAWQANEAAAAAATEQAQAWASTFSSIADTGGLSKLQEDARKAELALKTAQLQGAAPATLAELQAVYDEAVSQVVRFEEAMDTAIEGGLYTQQELIEIARQGGESLKEVIESGFLTPESLAELASGGGEALEALLRDGLLSDEQINQLIADGDEGIRAILDAFFGPAVIAAIEAGFNDISDADFAALAAAKPKGEEMSSQWVAGVLAGLEAGRLSVAQAIELLTDAAGEISDEAALSLLDTWRSVGDDLDRALATGEGLPEARAAYDQFLAFLTEFAAKHGLVAQDVIASWEAMETAANAGASSLSGKNFGVGGASSSSGIDQVLSELVEFSTSQNQLASIIEQVAGGDLSVTLADDTLSYLSGIFNDPALPQAFKDYVAEGLAQQLDDLGIGAEDQLATLNAELRTLGLEQLTADQWASMTRSEIEAIDEGTGRLADTIVTQTDRTIAAWDRYMAGASASGASLASAGRVAPAAGFGDGSGRVVERQPVILQVDRRTFGQIVLDITNDSFGNRY